MMQRPESDYRFFYVRSEPTLAAKQAFALTAHKPHKLEPKGFPVGCVAYTITKETDDYEVVNFAFSTHNPTDDYSRDAARAWAVYYLLVKNKNRASIQKAKTGLATKARIMQLLMLPSVPIRIREAAIYWLRRYTKPSRLKFEGPGPDKPFKVDGPLGPVTAKLKPQLVGRKKKR